jgi:Fic family protein
MKRGDYTYIWQSNDWPNWSYDLGVLAPQISEVCLKQGMLLGRVVDLGLDLRAEASLSTLTEDVVKTSEIEGEHLDPHSVRSSIARRLGIDIGGLAPTDRHVEGVVEMVLDATSNYQEPLSQARLFAWHTALFPTGGSLLTQITIGNWRNDLSGPMQVVSGAIGKERVHFEAPSAGVLNAEISRFIQWANEKNDIPPIIKAGIAHLWFVTIHPFDDGNGRIARAIGDLFLSRADNTPQRFYSLSAQIQQERKAYYKILEETQKGSLDITKWLGWFLGTLYRAISEAEHNLETIHYKSRFWQHWASHALNDRQIKLLHRLLDGFDGKLTSNKWSLIGKCSMDTALRDINELIALGILEKMASGGRSTSYQLARKSNKAN